MQLTRESLVGTLLNRTIAKKDALNRKDTRMLTRFDTSVMQVFEKNILPNTLSGAPGIQLETIGLFISFQAIG